MEEIIWFRNDGRSRGNKSTSDVTVSLRKNGKENNKVLSIRFRNEIAGEFKSDFIRFGLSKDGKKMFFLPARREDGWKLNGYKGNESTKFIVINSMKYDELLRFIGDYSMQVSEDDVLYIDSRERE